jgi:hypothetical protein
MGVSLTSKESPVATKAEQFRSEQQRSTKAPVAKKVVKASRTVRTAAAKAEAKSLPPTKSLKGSEHAQQMKSATAASRHGRRGG